MNYGCRYGMPHDLKPLQDTGRVKWEVCIICTKKFRWNKAYKGRIQNKAYLEAHIRNFAQRFGPTKRIYHKIYKSEAIKIVI